MTVAAVSDRYASPLLQLGHAERRAIFHLKSDLACPDARLRELKARAQGELKTRVPVVAALAERHGWDGVVEPLAAGSYHIVHSVVAKTGRRAVVRSTVSDLFAEDRGLLLEGLARSALERLAMGHLVPETKAISFRAGGAPFDYAVLAFAPGVVLRDLGDPILDEDADYLRAWGEALRPVHEIAADGAGLVDCDADAPLDRPRGALESWPDYVMLNLDRHIGACRDAGYVDAELAARIVRMFEVAQPWLRDRPMRLLHGDPGTHNVCIDPNTRQVTALIDWEDALVGDPLFDVAMVSTFQPARRMPEFMAGYGLASAGLEDKRLIALYFLRIALSKTVHRLRFAAPDWPG